MLLEADLLIAYLKKEDWLKPLARKVIGAVEEGKLKNIHSSTEVLHEMYYVFAEFATLETILADLAKVATLTNLSFLQPGTEVYLSAVHLAKSYRISSIFDAIYAATALSRHVPDHTIISTDEVFDRVPGLRRVRPGDLKL